MNHQNPATPHYSFTIDKTGSQHVYHYKQAKYSLRMLFPITVLCAVPAGLMIYSARLNLLAWLLLSLFFSGIIFGLLNATRRKRSFSISNIDFSVNGESYDRHHIHEIFVKAPGQQEQRSQIESSTLIVGTGAAGYMVAGAATAMNGARAIFGGAADGIKSEYRKKNYRIGILYGEKRITLASGLAEHTASALYSAIFKSAKAI